MATRVTTLKGFLVWTALIALMMLLLGLGSVTGLTQAFVGWALTSLAEALISGFAELQAQ